MRLTPEELAECDESSATLADYFAPFWRRLFENCAKEGFSEHDSLRLVQTYILSQCPHGVNGTE